MKKLLLFSVMALSVWMCALAGIEEKMSASTQLFIAERDGKITLDVKLPGPPAFSRPPMLRQQPVDRYIAAAERVGGIEMVGAFIHIDPNRTSKLENMGVIVQERFKTFVVAMIPVDKLERVAELSEVSMVNVASKVQLRTNQARYYTNTDDVLNYSNDAILAGLPQAFKGTGVVVGVIDDGIDFQHTMFKDASGNWRVKRAYIARGSGSFNTYTSITSSSPTTDDSGESHGTHTSSTAGGSDITYSGTTYGGMAPESQLVLVGCGSYLYNTNLAMGIRYVFDYADSQNMPAVCSLSLGSHFGPHDGTGELAEVHAQYAGTHANHIIVYAAGNEAGFGSSYGYVHAEGNASSSTPFSTVMNGYGSSSKNSTYYGYDVFYARTSGRQVACRLHVVNTSTNQVMWTSSAITSTTSSVSGLSTYFSGSCQVTISRDSYSNKYYVQLYTNLSKKSSYSSSNYALAISVYPTSGSCYIDAWDVNGYNYFANYSRTIGDYTFVSGSDDASVGDEAADDNVISVGAYASKRQVTDYRGTSHTLSEYTVGDIAYFSSYQTAGHGATGVAKPDICAPGATIVAGVNHYDSNFLNNGLSTYGYYCVSNNGTSSLGNLDGTSMATPCAAGIIGLYLQAAKYAGKTLNTEGIRDVFANTAIHDSYTTKVNFGRYGKIDALAGIKYILGSTPMPTPELTVDPTSLTFAANTGETVTKTFTVTGTNLTGNVNVAVSGNYYSVTPTTITPAQATAGATVTVTYAPSAAGTHTGTVTLTSAGADNKTVSLNGTATAVPAINVNPTALTFNTTVGTPVTQTINVQGSNLTATVYVTVSGTGFTVDKTNITRTTANNGTTVTVTYNPTAVGTHTGTVTFTSSGAETQTVTLNGTAVGVPTITASPTTLSFNTTVGEPVTQTFTVTGADLTGNVSLAVQGTGFTIDKTSITRNQATNGSTVTVTYNPTAAGNHTGTVTLTSTGAQTVTVSLNGTATAIPALTADPTTLNMVTLVGTPVTQTFTVTGTNLTNNVALAVQGTGFTIDKTSITRTQATSGSTVTVTYSPTAFGIHTGTVTITSAGAEPVTVTLNGQADLVKFAPVMLPANEEFIDLTQFRADWTDETPAQNVASYTLEVTPKPVEPEIPEVQELANIDFSNVTAVVDGDQLPNQISNYAQYVPAGWTVNTYLWVNDGYVISGQNGSFVSPTYDLTGYDKVTVVLDTYSYYASYYGTASISVSTSQASQNLTLATDDFRTYTIVLDCADSDRVTIAGTAYYFALRSIQIYAGDLTAATASLMANETGGPDYRLITGITPDKFYTVENLTAEGTFLYHVKALYLDGTESDWSNVEEVTLYQKSHGFDVGDVNHDGVINIKDVTDLIDALLGTSTVCEICADVKADGTINIADVTALIDLLLESPTQSIKSRTPLGFERPGDRLILAF